MMMPRSILIMMTKLNRKTNMNNTNCNRKENGASETIRPEIDESKVSTGFAAAQRYWKPIEPEEPDVGELRAMLEEYRMKKEANPRYVHMPEDRADASDEYDEEDEEIYVKGAYRQLHAAPAKMFEKMSVEEREEYRKELDRKRAEEHARQVQEEWAKYADVPEEIWQAMNVLLEHAKPDDGKTRGTRQHPYFGWCSTFREIISEHTDPEIYDEYVARKLIKNVRGVVIARHASPAVLWMYNHDAKCLDGWKDSSTLIVIDPRMLDASESNASTGDMNDTGELFSAEVCFAAQVLASNLEVVYDERRGDGYAYDTFVEEREYTDLKTGEVRKAPLVRKWALCTGEEIDIPGEFYYLQACDDVSFTTDELSAFYADIAIGGTKKERELSKERQAKQEEPDGAHNRLFHRHFFEYALAVACCNDVERPKLDEIAMKLYERPRLVRLLAHTDFSGAKRPNDDVLAVTRLVKGAVMGWEHIRGSNGWHVLDSIEEVNAFLEEHPRGIVLADRKRENNRRAEHSIRKNIESTESGKKLNNLALLGRDKFDDIYEEDELTISLFDTGEIYEAIDNRASNDELLALIREQVNRKHIPEVMELVRSGMDKFEAIDTIREKYSD